MVVVGLEGVGPWLVGACGAHAARTPNIDAVSARGEVLAHCFVDTTTLSDQLQSFWTGRHALARGAEDSIGGGPPSDAEGNVWCAARARGVPVTLLTDNAEVAKRAEQAGCEQAILVEAPGDIREPAEDAFGCACMGVFQAAAELIAEGATGLVWVHSRGLYAPWDAPLALRQQMTDPDDPTPPDGVEPPGPVPQYRPRWLGETRDSEDFDPDIVVGWNQVAVAQTSVLDEGVGLLRAAVAARPNVSWDWLIHSFGQVPLGEHGSLGAPLPVPYLEHLRMLAIIARGDSPVPRYRQAIFQLPDLHSVLREQLGVPRDPDTWGEMPEEDRWDRHWLAAIRQRGEGVDPAVWVRTPAWSLRKVGQVLQLFVQPDDRWEACDISDREPSVVEALEQLYEQMECVIKDGARDRMPAPAEELVNMIRS